MDVPEQRNTPIRGDTGGGYEWQAAPAYGVRVRRNIGAITLGQESNLTRLATVRDGAMIPDADIKALIKALMVRSLE
jgi:hypothetical protein